MKAVYLKIHGRVQGVFFRKYTQLKALELGINGWVQNCADETVEVYAEGNPPALEEFIEWYHKGPEKAHVSKIDITEAALKNFRSFEVKR